MHEDIEDIIFLSYNNFVWDDDDDGDGDVAVGDSDDDKIVT